MHFNASKPERDLPGLRRIIEMGNVIAKRSRILWQGNGIEPASDGDGRNEPIMQFDDFNTYYTSFFKEQDIGYAYLYTVVEIDKIVYGWIILTKVPFSLINYTGSIFSVPHLMPGSREKVGEKSLI